MKELRIDVGVYTLLHINLTDVDFTGIKEIVFTVKNVTLADAPAIIERSFTEPGFYEVLISPKESVKLTDGALYDFIQILEDGTRLKITENGRIKLRKSVGDSFG